MPLLPMKALRRMQGREWQEEGSAAPQPPGGEGGGGRRRVTRGVTLATSLDTPSAAGVGGPLTPKQGKARCMSLGTAEFMATPRSSGIGGTPEGPGNGEETRLLRRGSMPQPLMVTPKGGGGAPPLVRSPVASRVTWAPSPQNQTADVTPYAKVYGVHPAFFDFDQHGVMQPSALGALEMQKGTLRALTPSCKGRMAMVVQGTRSPSSSSSPLAARGMRQNSGRGGQQLGFFPQGAASGLPFALGEQVYVLTDDGQAWMDGHVIAAYHSDTEAEGYSIPGGTLKVSYELGIKWVMPQNIGPTLRKKAPPSGNFPPAYHPRQGYPGSPLPQQQQLAGASWHAYAGNPQPLSPQMQQLQQASVRAVRGARQGER